MLSHLSYNSRSMSPLFVGPTQRLLVALVSSVQARPALFNSATGCTLFAGSDALAQGIEQGQPSLDGTRLSDKNDENNQLFSMIDTRRLLSAGLIGVMFGGFVYPFAYARLDKLWVGVNFASVVKKSLLEIATVGIFVNSVSIGCRGLLVGKTSQDVSSHVAQEMPTVTLNDARVWLPYNMVAFSLIPIYIRPATTSLMEAMWQTYISLRSNDYQQALQHAAASPSSSPEP